MLRVPVRTPSVLSGAGTGGVIGKRGVIEGQDGPHLPELDVPRQDSQAGTTCSTELQDGFPRLHACNRM